jgi:hypothetical protein
MKQRYYKYEANSTRAALQPLLRTSVQPAPYVWLQIIGGFTTISTARMLQTEKHVDTTIE